MVFAYDTILFLSAFLFALATTGIAWYALRKSAVLDIPNARSNHTIPTPRGGGLALMGVAICFLVVSSAENALILSSLVLMGISFLDDKRGVPARWRMLAQAVAVFWLLKIEYLKPMLPFLPFPVEVALVGLAWMWFINLFNFMDGADGLASGEAFAICASIAVVALSVHLHYHIMVFAMVMAGSILGFAVWNWQPAKIFLGDSGSIPLGFILGYLLFLMAQHGYAASALILPAYFISDATLTLVYRLLQGDVVWQAHSKHAYQRAIRAGQSHAQVVKKVLFVDILLMVLAVVSTLGAAWVVPSIACAYLISFLLMLHFVPERE